MEKRNNEVTMKGNPVTLLGPKKNIGDIAPDFTVLAPDMSPIKLSDFAGKVKVINVVPSIDTPICDMQVRHFNKDAASLGDVVILSISVDLPFALSRYCAANGIDAVKTTSDHRETDFGLKYGFLIENLRLLSRGILVVDKNDKITYVEYVPEVASEPDYEKALEAVKAAL